MLKEATEGEIFNGVRAFYKRFEDMNNHDGCFLQKCRNKPKHEVLYCYIVANNKVLYRCNVSHWQAGGDPIEVIGPDDKLKIITWPHLVLTAPVVPAPFNIPFKGFQGFRYIENELW